MIEAIAALIFAFGVMIVCCFASYASDKAFSDAFVGCSPNDLEMEQRLQKAVVEWQKFIESENRVHTHPTTENQK